MENQQGTLKITKAYICIYREKGKPSSKPPFLGAMLIFQGVEIPEAESYVRTPTKKNNFYLKNPRILLFEKNGQMATWVRIAMDGKVIRYTPWKVNRGPKNHPNVYVYTKKGEKPSSKPPCLGATLSFQGVETPEAESYLLFIF